MNQVSSTTSFSDKSDDAGGGNDDDDDVDDDDDDDDDGEDDGDDEGSAWLELGIQCCAFLQVHTNQRHHKIHSNTPHWNTVKYTVFVCSYTWVKHRSMHCNAFMLFQHRTKWESRTAHYVQRIQCISDQFYALIIFDTLV